MKMKSSNNTEISRSSMRMTTWRLFRMTIPMLKRCRESSKSLRPTMTTTNLTVMKTWIKMTMMRSLKLRMMMKKWKMKKSDSTSHLMRKSKAAVRYKKRSPRKEIQRKRAASKASKRGSERSRRSERRKSQ